MPYTRASLLAGLLAIGCAGRAPDAAVETDRQLVRVERSSPAMGTTFRVVVYAPDEAAGGAAAESALARVRAVEACLTDWDPASPVRRLGAAAGAPEEAPDDLLAVLAVCARAVELSGGAFDPTVGPLTRPWRRARRQGEAPDPASLEAARAAVGWQRLVLDLEGRTVALTAPGMALDLGGVAKGYALDQALARLRAHGLERALVDGGGDVAAGAPPPGRAGWTVDVRPLGADGSAPFGALTLRDAAACTSGERHGAARVDGALRTHLIDPRTGDARARGLAATVVARDAALADALASGLCIDGRVGLEALRAGLVPADGVLQAWVLEVGDGATPGSAPMVTRLRAGTTEVERGPP